MTQPQSFHDSTAPRPRLLCEYLQMWFVARLGRLGQFGATWATCGSLSGSDAVLKRSSFEAVAVPSGRGEVTGVPNLGEAEHTPSQAIRLKL